MTKSHVVGGALGIGVGLSLHYGLRSFSERGFANAVADFDFQRAEESIRPVFLLDEWGLLAALAVIGALLALDPEAAI